MLLLVPARNSLGWSLSLVLSTNSANLGNIRLASLIGTSFAWISQRASSSEVADGSRKTSNGLTTSSLMSPSGTYSISCGVACSAPIMPSPPCIGISPEGIPSPCIGIPSGLRAASPSVPAGGSTGTAIRLSPPRGSKLTFRKPVPSTSACRSHVELSLVLKANLSSM